MMHLIMRTSLRRLVSSALVWKHVRGRQTCVEDIKKLRTFTPTMTSHPIFERRGDENIWRSQDTAPKTVDLSAHLRSTPWIDIVSPEIRQSFDDHADSYANAANYLVGWSGIFHNLLPRSYGYSLQWEVVTRHTVNFEHLAVCKRDPCGNKRVVLLVVAHADYAGVGDYEEYMKWRVGFLATIIDRWTGEAMDSGEAGEELPWIGVMGHRFILGIKDKYSGLNRIGNESNKIFDVYHYSSKPVLLNFVKNIHSLVL